MIDTVHSHVARDIFAPVVYYAVIVTSISGVEQNLSGFSGVGS